MKRIGLLLVILTCCTTVDFGQVVSISCDRENIFYTGMANPVTIAVSNESYHSIKIHTTNGRLEGKNGSYTFTPEHVGKADFTIYKQFHGKSIEIGKYYFRVRDIPSPVFKIGSGRDSISLPELKAQQFVRADIEGLDIDFKLTVYRFTTCIISNNPCRYVELVNDGNAINEEIKKEFQSLKAGDIVIFKEISCVGPAGNMLLKPIMTILY
jgi:hypothetical protein